MTYIYMRISSIKSLLVLIILSTQAPNLKDIPGQSAFMSMSQLPMRSPLRQLSLSTIMEIPETRPVHFPADEYPYPERCPKAEELVKLLRSLNLSPLQLQNLLETEYQSNLPTDHLVMQSLLGLYRLDLPFTVQDEKALQNLVQDWMSDLNQFCLNNTAWNDMCRALNAFYKALQKQSTNQAYSIVLVDLVRKWDLLSQKDPVLTYYIRRSIPEAVSDTLDDLIESLYNKVNTPGNIIKLHTQNGHIDHRAWISIHGLLNSSLDLWTQVGLLNGPTPLKELRLQYKNKPFRALIWDLLQSLAHKHQQNLVALEYLKVYFKPETERRELFRQALHSELSQRGNVEQIRGPHETLGVLNIFTNLDRLLINHILSLDRMNLAGRVITYFAKALAGLDPQFKTLSAIESRQYNQFIENIRCIVRYMNNIEPETFIQHFRNWIDTPEHLANQDISIETLYQALRFMFPRVVFRNVRLQPTYSPENFAYIWNEFRKLPYADAAYLETILVTTPQSEFAHLPSLPILLLIADKAEQVKRMLIKHKIKANLDRNPEFFYKILFNLHCILSRHSDCRFVPTELVDGSSSDWSDSSIPMSI